MEPRIGLRFGDTDKEGVILQSTMCLTIFHNREDEVGPFFGVMYNHKPYEWYNYEQIKEIINR